MGHTTMLNRMIPLALLLSVAMAAPTTQENEIVPEIEFPQPPAPPPAQTTGHLSCVVDSGSDGGVTTCGSKWNANSANVVVGSGGSNGMITRHGSMKFPLSSTHAQCAGQNCVAADKICCDADCRQCGGPNCASQFGSSAAGELPPGWTEFDVAEHCCLSTIATANRPCSVVHRL